MNRRLFHGITSITVGAILCASVVLKRAHIDRKRAEIVPGIITEHREKGIPVTVLTADASDIIVTRRFPLTVSSPATLSGYIPRDLRARAFLNQEVRIPRYPGLSARLSYLGTSLDIDTGMYPVTVSYKGEADFDRPFIYAEIDTRTLTQVIVLPDYAIGLLGDSYYVWVIEDNHARKRSVVPGRQGEFGVTINEGLDPGVRVVKKGGSLLREGSKVRIVNDEPRGEERES